MSEKLQVLVVHAACILVICICFYLAELTPLKTVLLSGTPALSRALECAGFLLWGKLGFKPAEVIVAKIIAGMEPEKVVQIMSTRPPKPTAAPPGGDVAA
jgi:hypothetical protein